MKQIPPSTLDLMRILPLAMFLLVTAPQILPAAELPLMRVAHGAFNEKVLALWIGVERGFFSKYGVEVEVVDIRNGPLTIQALASDEVQVGYTVPSSVLSAVIGGMDIAFFAGLVNRPDGDLIVTPEIRTPRDLKGKRLGIQSVGGGVWSMTMLALENLGLEPTRDNITLITLGDQSVLARSFMAGKIDGTYLSYGYRPVLKETKHRLLLDLGKSQIAYQGLALVAQRAYLRRKPRDIDALLQGITESVAFIQNPANKAEVLKSLRKNLLFKTTQQAEIAYQALQWLYTFDMKPNLLGIQNITRVLSLTNPKMTRIRPDEVVEGAPIQRLENSLVYRKVISRGKG
jgi:ABC-type nitrate/sulfonate/bicarbonate transport system substrate-binding protein